MTSAALVCSPRCPYWVHEDEHRQPPVCQQKIPVMAVNGNHISKGVGKVVHVAQAQPETHLWSDGESPKASPVEKHVVPCQEDVVTGGGDKGNPSKLTLDECKFPPGKCGSDRGE